MRTHCDLSAKLLPNHPWTAGETPNRDIFSKEGMMFYNVEGFGQIDENHYSYLFFVHCF